MMFDKNDNCFDFVKIIFFISKFLLKLFLQKSQDF